MTLSTGHFTGWVRITLSCRTCRRSQEASRLFPVAVLQRHACPFFRRNSSLLTANGVEMLDAYIYDQYLKEAATRATPESLYSWILQLYNSFHWQGGTVRCFGANLHQDNRRIYASGTARCMSFVCDARALGTRPRDEANKVSA